MLGRLRPRRLHTRPRSSHEASGSPAVTRSTEMVHVYACVGKLLSVRSTTLSPVLSVVSANAGRQYAALESGCGSLWPSDRVRLVGLLRAGHR